MYNEMMERVNKEFEQMQAETMDTNESDFVHAAYLLTLANEIRFVLDEGADISDEQITALMEKDNILMFFVETYLEKDGTEVRALAEDIIDDALYNMS